MSVRTPDVLSRIKDTQLLIDAAYFTVRVLRNTRRGYKKAEVSTEPSHEVRHLAETAIKQIEQKEGRTVLTLSDDRIREYIAALETLVLSKSAAVNDVQLREAERILRQMRAG